MLHDMRCKSYASSLSVHCVFVTAGTVKHRWSLPPAVPPKRVCLHYHDHSVSTVAVPQLQIALALHHHCCPLLQATSLLACNHGHGRGHTSKAPAYGAQTGMILHVRLYMHACVSACQASIQQWPCFLVKPFLCTHDGIQIPAYPFPQLSTARRG